MALSNAFQAESGSDPALHLQIACNLWGMFNLKFAMSLSVKEKSR